MASNFFQDYQAQKENLLSTAAQAGKLGWIDAQTEALIVDKINSDVLTIGVIGQMNCGKSTFLNAFVFGANVLPTDNTAMTAAITVITYGEEARVVAEFYTRQEWEQLSLSGSRHENVSDDLLELLSTEKEDTFESLRSYVGNGGKYNPITKSVTIYYPLDYLRGVEIVDTPGFNDPNEIREQRTRSFLNRADVVVLLLYAGKAFDEKDNSILFDYVRNCGIGKVILGINKFDIQYGEGDTVNEIRDYVISLVNEQAERTGDRQMIELIKDSEPVLISSEMALMAQLPTDQVVSDEHFNAAWKRACDNFEISTAEQMAQCSNISGLIEAVRQVIERDKIEILLRKPYNAIMAAAVRKKDELQLKLNEAEQLVANLQKPDTELEQKLEYISRAEAQILREIDTFNGDMDFEFRKIIRTGRRQMEDEVDASCARMKRMVENMKRLENIEDIRLRIESEYNTLILRRLRNIFSDMSDQAMSTFNRLLGEFCVNSENTLVRYLSDFDSRYFISSMKHRVSYDVENRGLFTVEKESGEDAEKSFLKSVAEAITKFFVAYFNKIKGGYDFITDNRDPKRELLQIIERTRIEFSADKFLNSLIERKTQVMDYVRSIFMEELTDPLREQIKEIRNNISDRDKSLEVAAESVDTLKNEIDTFNQNFSRVFG